MACGVRAGPVTGMADSRAAGGGRQPRGPLRAATVREGRDQGGHKRIAGSGGICHGVSVSARNTQSSGQAIRLPAPSTAGATSDGSWQIRSAASFSGLGGGGNGGSGEQFGLYGISTGHIGHCQQRCPAPRTGDRYEQARAHRDVAESCQAASRSGRARQHWQHAPDIYIHLGVPEAARMHAAPPPSTRSQQGKPEKRGPVQLRSRAVAGFREPGNSRRAWLRDISYPGRQRPGKIRLVAHSEPGDLHATAFASGYATTGAESAGN